AGTAGALEIVVSTQGSKISGLTRDNQGNPAPAGLVTMWPSAAAIADPQGGVRVFAPSPQGTFQASGIAPGEYFLVAWQQAPPDLSRIPDFLDLFRTAAAKIRVTEGEAGSVEMKMLPQEAVDKAVEQFR